MAEILRSETAVLAWFTPVRDEVYRRVAATRLTEACRRGEHTVIAEFFICFWPFVNVFPAIIRQSRRPLIQSIRQKGSASRVNDLLALGRHTLATMQRDEANHRTLWIECAATVGLGYANLASRRYAETERIIEHVAEDTDPATKLLRFTAVERVAESVSAALLASAAFRQAVGPQGLPWFEVHLSHIKEPQRLEELSHEELTIGLATALEARGDTEEAGRTVLATTDLFVAAAEAAHAYATR